MSSWSTLLECGAPEEHFVQLYGQDDSFLTRNVTRYLVEGMVRGEAMLVIATPGHVETIRRGLQQERAPVAESLRSGWLVFLDAEATLDRFMVGGQPDRALFEDRVGGAIAELFRRVGHRRLRAFGEMVGLLWQRGQLDAAIRLEEYWNALLAETPACLFCAYPIDVFDAPEGKELRSILNVHTHLCAGPKTMLSRFSDRN